MRKTEVPPDLAVCRRSVGAATLTYGLYRTRGAYGLLVSSDTQADCIRVDNLTKDPSLAKRIQQIFARNLVFPDNVHEVLDDLLGISL